MHLVIDGSPVVQGHVLEPVAARRHDRWPPPARPGGDLLDDDYLEILGAEGLQPRLLYPNGFKRVNRFAFVIHPLSQEYFKKVKPIEVLSRVSPPLLMDSLEKVMAYAPPFVYSKVEGIRSPTGVEAEGWLIAVGGTPQGDHEPQPRVHLPAAARRGRHGAASWARRSWAWAPSPRWSAMPA